MPSPRPAPEPPPRPPGAPVRVSTIGPGDYIWHAGQFDERPGIAEVRLCYYVWLVNMVALVFWDYEQPTYFDPDEIVVLLPPPAPPEPTHPLPGPLFPAFPRFRS